MDLYPTYIYKLNYARMEYIYNVDYRYSIENLAIESAILNIYNIGMVIVGMMEMA